MSDTNKKPRRSLPNGEVWNQAAWKEARKRAMASKNPICAICQTFVDVTAPMVLENGERNPLACEVDHINPTSRGGALYELENLQLTHMKCNRKKGARMDSDYDSMPMENLLPLSNPW